MLCLPSVHCLFVYFDFVVGFVYNFVKPSLGFLRVLQFLRGCAVAFDLFTVVRCISAKLELNFIQKSLYFFFASAIFGDKNTRNQENKKKS